MSVTRSQRFEILARDNFTCRYCGRRAPHVQLHVDHVHPVSRGGTDDPLNLVAACVDCNMGKLAKELGPGAEMPLAQCPSCDRAFLPNVSTRRKSMQWLGTHCDACIRKHPAGGAYLAFRSRWTG